MTDPLFLAFGLFVSLTVLMGWSWPHVKEVTETHLGRTEAQKRWWVYTVWKAFLAVGLLLLAWFISMLGGSK